MTGIGNIMFPFVPIKKKAHNIFDSKKEKKKKLTINGVHIAGLPLFFNLYA